MNRATLWVLSLGLAGVAAECSAASSLTAVWANDGTDKVWQYEIRATQRANVLNRVWDGKVIHQAGAKNEVVSIALVLETQAGAANVGVKLSPLVGPGGAQIATGSPAKGDGVFNYVNRPVEVFVARYLQIKGINTANMGYTAYYDERHVPSKMRRPLNPATPRIGVGGWADRPGADQFVPDALVPIELTGSFLIAPASSQIVWVDIYIPTSAATGSYSGTLTVSESGSATWNLPLQLNVYGFALPDSPAGKTMLCVSRGDISRRYLPPNASPKDVDLIVDNHYKLLHRHKLSGIDGYEGSTASGPGSGYLAKLNGSFFTPANGYDGPGVKTSNDIYSIGTYGSWQGYRFSTAGDIQKMLDSYELWFRANAPGVERLWYVVDEPPASALAQTNQWLAAKTDPAYAGPGRAIPAVVTYPLPRKQDLPGVDWFFSAVASGITPEWESAISAHRSQGANKKFSWYNGARPALGSDTLEDDGASPRMVMWAMTKRQMNRYFIWLINYYYDYQSGSGDTDVWGQAKTFGQDGSADPVFGRKGYNRTNGDGVWVYPGKDVKFPVRSLEVNGPIASIRLKQLRRGVQDVDYVALARAVDKAATDAIVNSMVPKVMWEVGVQTTADPTYVWTDISWPTSGDAWEDARARLAAIILTGTAARSAPNNAAGH